MATESFWQDLTVTQQRSAETSTSRRFLLADPAALEQFLAAAPGETETPRTHQFALPMPDGAFASFAVVEVPVMAAALGARFPEIRTYRVTGIDGEQVSGRVDLTPLGFHGMIQTPEGRIFIDPENFRARDDVYLVRNVESGSGARFHCGVEGHSRDLGEWLAPQFKTANRVPGSLIQYDLAVAVTLEYYNFFGASDPNTTAAIATTLNRVNFIYERDLGIRLLLVADNPDIYESMESGILDNEDEFSLLAQVNNWIDTRLTGGDAAYDIGHMFSNPAGFGGSGVANLGAVCDSNIKAGGVSGFSDPSVGDPFDVDLVAHEIGHQFNANHSFNGSTSSCVNRNADSAFEPGSGSTIMAYAGICALENLQSNSDATFHAGSIAQINAFTAAGGSCFSTIPTTVPGNTDPAVNALTNRTIPANTPFILDAIASDPDTDPLEYSWDQMDAGCATNATSFGTDNGSNALFRSYAPRAESWRNFPALGTQVRGRYDKAEVLACHNRALDFRVTARDGRSGQATRDIRVTVSNAAGPFAITNLATPQSVFAGTSFEVTWDRAGTHLAPVSCASVDIDLLTFALGYGSYSIYPLATNTANDESEFVTINPNTAAHPRARIRVKCNNSIFYDISDADLTVVQTVGPGVNPGDTDFPAYSFATIGITSTTPPACGPIVDCTPPPINTGSGGRDSGAIDYLWLLLLTGLVGAVKLRRRYG